VISNTLMHFAGRLNAWFVRSLSRRREHLHARALPIRAELSTHNHRETGPQRPTHSFWSFLLEKTKLECGKKLPAFRQRQAHNAVRQAARSRPARSATGHRARTRAGRRAECVCEAESELESVCTGSPSWFWGYLRGVWSVSSPAAASAQFTI